MIALTEAQERELRRYAAGKPRRPVPRPNTNLVRRNLLTTAPPYGKGWYQITDYGRAALAEREGRA